MTVAARVGSPAYDLRATDVVRSNGLDGDRYFVAVEAADSGDVAGQVIVVKSVEVDLGPVAVGPVLPFTVTVGDARGVETPYRFPGGTLPDAPVNDPATLVGSQGFFQIS